MSAKVKKTTATKGQKKPATLADRLIRLAEAQTELAHILWLTANGMRRATRRTR